MINNKEITKKYFNNRIIEGFSKSRKLKKTYLDKLIDLFPFFVRWPIQFFYNIWKQAVQNKKWYLLIFLFFAFTYIKKIVRTNLQDTYRYRYGTK